MGFSKISADADLKGGVWHILPSGEHREWSPLVPSLENTAFLSVLTTMVMLWLIDADVNKKEQHGKGFHEVY